MTGVYDCPRSESNTNVSHPSHYTQGKIECLDYIIDQKMTYCIGNAVKYLTRYRFKEHPMEDLAKAIVYIQRELREME